MRLKQKPSRPTRRMIEQTNSLPDTLQDAIDWAKKFGVDPSDVKLSIENNGDYYGDHYTAEMRCEVPESDVEFEYRMDKYNSAMKKWQKWYDENKDAIEAKKKENEIKRQEKAAEAKSKELDRLRRERQRIDKILQKVQNETLKKP